MLDGAGDLFGPPGTVAVKVSAASARLRFHGCEPGYIRDVCHAACCRSTVHPDGILVTIHPGERARVEAAGGEVVAGRLRPAPGARRCPFQHATTHLCGLHGTPAKPFGCIASPFTLNAAGTLVVRNRYKLLRCYEDGAPPVPAYVAFRASLVLIFGAPEAARVAAHLAAGGGDMIAWCPEDSFRILRDNDAAKHTEAR